MPEEDSATLVKVALLDPVWMATPRYQSVRTGVRKDMILHGLRNGFTLCGWTAWKFSWVEVDSCEDFSRCAFCAAIPQGHCTQNDITALGITYRQLDHWVRQGWLPVDNPGCGSGFVRTFPPEALTIARHMAIYTAAGVMASAAHHAALHDGWLNDTVRVMLDERTVLR